MNKEFSDWLQNIANLSAIIVAIPPIWNLLKTLYFRVFKHKTITTPQSSSDSYTHQNFDDHSINQTFNIQNTFGYPNYSLTNTSMSKIEYANYNSKSLLIWRTISILMLVVFLTYLIPALQNINFDFTINKLSDNSSNLYFTFQDTSRKTFNTLFFTQIFFSVLVIIKMILNPRVRYRKINIFVYTLSAVAIIFLYFLFSNLNLTSLNLSTFYAPSTSWHDSMIYLLAIYSIAVMILQLLYPTVIIANAIKTLWIGEVQFKLIEKQKFIYLGKLFQIIAPILLILFWYIVKTFMI